MQQAACCFPQHPDTAHHCEPSTLLARTDLELASQVRSDGKDGKKKAGKKGAAAAAATDGKDAAGPELWRGHVVGIAGGGSRTEVRSRGKHLKKAQAEAQREATRQVNTARHGLPPPRCTPPDRSVDTEGTSMLFMLLHIVILGHPDAVQAECNSEYACGLQQEAHASAR